MFLLVDEKESVERAAFETIEKECRIKSTVEGVSIVKERGFFWAESQRMMRVGTAVF